MSKKKGKRDLVDESRGFGSTLGNLLVAAGIEPMPPEAVDDADESVTKVVQPALDWALLDKARVQVERKGRRGKTVTLLIQRELSVDTAQRFGKSLGQHFGCRGFIEDGQICLQGDQANRLISFMAERGVNLSKQGG